MKINTLKRCVFLFAFSIFFVGVQSYELKAETTSQKQEQNTVPIYGTVKDSNGEPLPGTSVFIKGTSIGTTTDYDGNFNINVEEGQTIVFSFMGFKNQEIVFKNQSSITITLIENVNFLDGVVIIGYGSQKIKDVTGSISYINSEAIEERPVVQVTDALAGKAAGVQVTIRSGKPQGGASVVIRGTTSLSTSSEPLYVIDGVPAQTMYDVNPNDIESISILKDASAAAIYGSAGANGVVIINTKRGTDSKPVISFSSYSGVSRLPKKMGTLNSTEYIDLMDELGLTTDWSQYTANTDWQDEIYRIATRQNYQLSVAGSEKGLNYYASGNFQSNEGIIRTSIAERTTGKLNIDKQVNKWLKFGASVMYASWYDVEVSENVGKGNGSPITGALITPELIGVFNEDGTYTGNPLATDWENPVATTDAAERGYRSKRFLGSSFLEAEIIEGLKFKTRFSIDNNHGTFKYYLDNHTTSQGRAKNGMASESRSESSYWILENLLTYKKKINNHDFTLLGGVIFSKTTATGMSIDVSNFGTDKIEHINAGGTIDGVSGYESHKSNESFLGRVNYGYKSKYLLTANFRADGSSVFGPNSRWGFFPSFSAGWRITEENFMSDIKFFDEIKLRIGWGKVGNDRIPAYSFYGSTEPGFDYVLGGSIVPGIASTSLENSDLKWEETTQTDIGLDLTFLKQRLHITVDVYQKYTTDVLLFVEIPTSSGFTNSWQNIGETKNKGIEFSIAGDIIKGKEFSWTSNFNISFNRNKAIYLKGQDIYRGYITQRGEVVKIEEGEELFNFWGYVAEGVDPATGDMIYQDLNGDGKITDDGDKKIIGNANPDFFYGFTNTFSYKGISLNIFLQGTHGNDIFNASRILMESMNDHKSQSDIVLERWRQAGDITDIPRATRGAGPNNEAKYNSMLSSRFIEDGSYLRIKTLTLGYDFDHKLLERAHIAKARIYVTAENLFTSTKYSGYDPEVNYAAAGSLVTGVDYGTYPQPKSIIFGLNLSF